MKIILSGRYRGNYHPAGGGLKLLEFQAGEHEVSQEIYDFLRKDVPALVSVSASEFSDNSDESVKSVEFAPVDKMVRKGKARTK